VKLHEVTRNITLAACREEMVSMWISLQGRA